VRLKQQAMGRDADVHFKISTTGDFPGGSGVKTTSSVGATGLIPGQ